MNKTRFKLLPFKENKDFSVNGNLSATDAMLQCELFIRGNLTSLNIPKNKKPEMKEGLWDSTCFEIFLKSPGSPQYVEWNFSPSGDWWFTQFARYRIRSLYPASLSPHSVTWEHSYDLLKCIISIPLLEREGKLGLACILATTDHEKSYWALEHPASKPDFHDDRSFHLSLIRR